MRFLRVFLAIGSILLVPVSLRAGQATKKFDFAPVNGIQQVDLVVGDVRLNQIIFDLHNTGGIGPLRRSGSDAEVRLDNNGAKDVEAGVALVLMDADGNVVGAGSGGTKVGWLRAGERDKYTVNFPYVYRYVEKAKTVLVTVETRERPPSK
jgi:hypothetical protein